MSVQEFDRIYHAAGNGPKTTEGKLRFAPQGLGWKATATGEILTVKADDLRKLWWLRCTRAYQLRIATRDGRTLKFDNFPRDKYDEVRDAVRNNYKLPLDHLELSVKGWNWGKAETEPDHLVFRVSGKPLFELPYDQIANVNSGKNEVTIECVTPDLARNAGEDQLVECRMHVPGMAALDNDVDGVDVDGDQDKEDGQQTAADFLCEAIKSKADLGVEKGDTIVSFKELPFLTPRGRYDVEMFADFLRLRGKSYDYKINYAAITKLFMLPKPDDLHVIFVVGLDPPLRQGQTRYPFLVLQFVRDDEMMVEVNMDPQTLAEKYEGKLQRSYDSPTYEVVSAIFRGLTDKKITIPGSFRAASGALGIKCSLKANEGYMYPLEKSLLFIPKPPTLMLHTDVAHVTFSRVALGGSSRTIDMTLSLRSGTDVPLSNIPREEYAGLEAYFKDKKIKVKNELAEEVPLPYMDDSSDENDGDAGRRRAPAVATTGAPGLDDEDDESPDEDFVASSESDDSGDYSSSEGDESDEEEPSSKKRKASAEPASSGSKKAKTAGGSKSKEYVDSEDEDE